MPCCLLSAGAVYATWNCGIIFGFQELFTSESMSQVYYFLLKLVGYARDKGITLPAVGAYDDVSIVHAHCSVWAHIQTMVAGMPPSPLHHETACNLSLSSCACHYRLVHRQVAQHKH